MNAVTRVVDSCGAVAAAAADVRIDDGAMATLAHRLAAHTCEKPPAWDDGGWHYSADAAAGGHLTAQYVLVLDALNFCFWPSSTSLEYDTLASVLRDVLLKDEHALDADRLAAMTAETLRGWFAPHDLPNAEERARKLNEVGGVLAAEFNGRCIDLATAARQSAVRLVELVVRHFPGFRDESLYHGRQVFLYKRAQIFVADLWAAYGQQTAGASPAAFSDISELTCFADYRIPQLFRALGVFVSSVPLSAAVAARTEIMAGHPWEVEIRASTVAAVQRLRKQINAARAASAREAGAGDSSGTAGITSVEVDWLLWQEGERRKDEIPPHHRTLTVFY
jgi:hypothetical protein